jgi:dTDP-glucose 4,6-dehydratase
LEKGKAGEVYNIGTGSHLSNNDLATKIISLMGLNDSMKSYVDDRHGHDFRYSVDSGKIESLGFQRKIDFENGLKKTVEWYVTNPGWWDTPNKVT